MEYVKLLHPDGKPHTFTFDHALRIMRAPGKHGWTVNDPKYIYVNGELVRSRVNIGKDQKAGKPERATIIPEKEAEAGGSLGTNQQS